MHPTIHHRFLSNLIITFPYSANARPAPTRAKTLPAPIVAAAPLEVEVADVEAAVADPEAEVIVMVIEAAAIEEAAAEDSAAVAEAAAELAAAPEVEVAAADVAEEWEENSEASAAVEPSALREEDTKEEMAPITGVLAAALALEALGAWAQFASCWVFAAARLTLPGQLL